MGIARRLRDRYRAWVQRQRELGIERWRKNPRRHWRQNTVAIVLTFGLLLAISAQSISSLRRIWTTWQTVAPNLEHPAASALRWVGSQVWVLLVILLCSVVMFRSWLKLRRRYRWLCHRCTACDYDLSHTPDRCPECGHEREPACPF